jgi:propanol-preferring alcohol dehydrogenase
MQSMKAMVLERPGAPLVLTERTAPVAGPGQLLLRVKACAVCRTDLHIADGDLPWLGRPVIPGHEIVGEVIGLGDGAAGFAIGDRAGVPWLGWTCGRCAFCRSGQENLCDGASFTGYQIDGGFAELTVADARFCFPLPPSYSDAEAAPLLCAGLIGYRSLTMAGPGERLGVYGFGAAAHLITQLAVRQGREVYAFTRPGDRQAQDFARSLGCVWAGSSAGEAPVALDAAIIFAPVGQLVPVALAAVRKGGIVVCGGIHMSDIPSFPYGLIWGERQLRSVANLTRQDAHGFLAAAQQMPVRAEVIRYRLQDANAALDDLRAGRLSGAAVLIPTEI